MAKKGAVTLGFLTFQTKISETQDFYRVTRVTFGSHLAQEYYWRKGV